MNHLVCNSVFVPKHITMELSQNLSFYLEDGGVGKQLDL